MNLNEIKSRALNDLEANPHAAAWLRMWRIDSPLRPKLSDKLIWTPWRWPTFPMFGISRRRYFCCLELHHQQIG